MILTHLILLATQIFVVHVAGASQCDARVCINPGFNVVGRECSDAQTRTIAKIAESLVPILEAAAAHLHQRRNDGLFDYFFFPQDKPIVGVGINNLLQIFKRQSTGILISCEDKEGWEQSHGSYALNAMYEVPKHNTIPSVSYLFLLSKYFKIDPAPAICAEPQGVLIDWADQTTILLHELLHIRYLTGDGTEMLADPPGSDSYTIIYARRYRSEANQPLKPINSVINWLWYIRFAWTLKQQKTECPRDYPIWNYFNPNKPSGVQLQASVDGELRKLLAAQEAEAPGTVDLFTETRVLTGNDLSNATIKPIGTPGSVTTEISGGD